MENSYPLLIDDDKKLLREERKYSFSQRVLPVLIATMVLFGIGYGAYRLHERNEISSQGKDETGSLQQRVEYFSITNSYNIN